MKNLLFKYKDVILYLFFGICTTIVNVAVYWMMAYPLSCGTLLSTVLAWIISVLFAYFTNRKWVFHSEVKTAKEILAEIFYFFACRLATGVADWACMWLFVDVFKFNDIIIKIVSNIIVVILNYVASKLFIFKNKG